MRLEHPLWLEWLLETGETAGKLVMASWEPLEVRPSRNAKQPRIMATCWKLDYK